MAITVSAARTSLQNRKQDISDVGNATFIEWCDYINKFYWRMVTGIDPTKYIAETTISAVDGTVSYTRPTDFDNIDTLGTGIYPVDENGRSIEGSRLPLTNAGAAQFGYYFFGDEIVFTPTISTDNTYNLRYIPVLATLTALTDTTQIPDTFNLYMINALDVLYTIWDEMPNDEALADQRFVRALDNLASNISAPPLIASLPQANNY